MKKIKFHWGTGILISIIIFMIISVGTTLVFMNQDVELVTDNYYEKTLVYQDKIEMEKRTIEKNKRVFIENREKDILFTFPENVVNNYISGTISFYRPSNEKKDFNLPVNIDENGIQLINSENLEKGLWKVSVKWELKNEVYYSEKSIIIQ